MSDGTLTFTTGKRRAYEIEEPESATPPSGFGWNILERLSGLSGRSSGNGNNNRGNERESSTLGRISSLFSSFPSFSTLGTNSGDNQASTDVATMPPPQAGGTFSTGRNAAIPPEPQQSILGGIGRFTGLTNLGVDFSRFTGLNFLKTFTGNGAENDTSYRGGNIYDDSRDQGMPPPAPVAPQQSDPYSYSSSTSAKASNAFSSSPALFSTGGASSGAQPKLIVGLNSLDLFMSFIEEYPDPNDPSNTLYDASKILETECYESWINTRRASLKKPEESFRRALTAHVCGADRRRPFPEPVEDAVLRELRKQQTWPCFQGKLSENENKPIKIGEQGFRTMGYHEKKRYDKMQKQRGSDQRPLPLPYDQPPSNASYDAFGGDRKRHRIDQTKYESSPNRGYY